MFDSPANRAASTYSRFVTDITSARTRRATGGQDTMAMAMVIEVSVGSRIATSTMASAKLGMVWKNSVNRIAPSSTHLP